MKVVCIARRGETLPDHYLDARIPRTKEHDFRLTQNREYIVYAVAIRREQLWYYVLDDTDSWFPIYKPAPLFKIVDDRVSRHWRLKLTPENLDHQVLLAFEEWVSDDRFYGRLSDREDAETMIFRERRQQIAEEFEPQGTDGTSSGTGT